MNISNIWKRDYAYPEQNEYLKERFWFRSISQWFWKDRTTTTPKIFNGNIGFQPKAVAWPIDHLYIRLLTMTRFLYWRRPKEQPPPYRRGRQLQQKRCYHCANGQLGRCFPGWTSSPGRTFLITQETGYLGQSHQKSGNSKFCFKSTWGELLKQKWGSSGWPTIL